MRKTYDATLIFALLSSTSAFAQIADPAPVHQSVDANGVDLFLGTLNVSRTDASIGPSDTGMSYSRYWRNGAWVDNFDLHLFQANASTITVTAGSNAENFTGSGPSYTSQQGSGSILTRSGSSGSYVYSYTTSNGTVYVFNETQGYTALNARDIARAVSITQPNGARYQLAYTDTSYCRQRSTPGTTPRNPDDGTTCFTYKPVSRLSTVTNSFGYRLTYAYQAADTDMPSSLINFYKVTGISLSNLPTGATQQASYTQSSDVFLPTTATNAAGRTWTYNRSGGRITSIQRPGHSADIVISYDGSGRVSSVRDAANITTAYTYADSGTERTTSIKVGYNTASTAVFDIATQLMRRSTDENGHTTSYVYDANGRMTRLSAQDGNNTEYTYDSRGNRTRTVAHAKAGTGLSDIVTTAEFNNDCSNPKRCNKPTATVDGRRSRTTYEYDANGLITSMTRPTGANGDMPRQLFDYTTVTSPWDGNTLTLLKATRICAITQTCAGSANETVAETSYGAANANFAPASVTIRAGDNSVSATTSYGYDGARNVTQVTDPNGNVTRMSYLNGRELDWTLSPDPDSSGSLRSRKTWVSRNPDGTIESVVTGTADANGNNAQELQRQRYGYDAASRKIWERIETGGAWSALRDYYYNGLGRLECSSERMGNYSNVIGVVSPCDLSPQGASGPDRITRLEHDKAGRITREWAGYRTANAFYVDYNWTNNGKLERIIDRSGQATTYFYDGFDRLKYSCFMTTSCSSVPSDRYEETFYDENNNVTRLRRRGGATIDYQYDALDQLTVVAPSGSSWQDRSTRYTYDNLGRMKTAKIDDWNLNTTYRYDALGRLMGEQGPQVNVDYAYDAGGRLIFLGYGDGFWVNYDYYATGEMQRIREKGATSGTGLLAQIGIDGLGRRTSLIRGDGSSESRSYSHGGVGPWLAQLTQSMSGGASVTRSFSYDLWGRIAGRVGSNDAYAWRQTINIDRGYTVNGLNQYTRSGNITPAYDPRGNLSSAPSPRTGNNAEPNRQAGYVYNTQNMMVASGNDLYNYDALGRLARDGTPGANFGYAGDRMIVERFDNGQFKRYVYGPDEAPLVMYENFAVHDKRYLVPDERGSVIAVTNGSGGAQSINSYDDFGIPASGNYGRFGYTGQAWNPTMQMWYYKARIYSPTLGRFMQTDPIGYADGLNMYNYVGGDPVNHTDPTGLDACKPGDGGPNDICVYGKKPGSGTSVDIGGLVKPVANAIGDAAKAVCKFLGICKNKNKKEAQSNIGAPYNGGSITAEQVACRSCHGVATDAADRYTTDAENDELVSYVGDAASLIPLIGPEYRAALLMNTGRTTATSLGESLLMRQAQSSPSIGKVLGLRLGDPRLPVGAVKLEQRVGGAAVHYVRLPNGAFVDFKFVP